MNKILNSLIMLALFYFASLVERQLTDIDFKSDDKKRLWKEIGRGFILFILCSFWILILFNSNQTLISDD